MMLTETTGGAEVSGDMVVGGCQMLRTITWLAVVGVLLVWLSARPVVPGWLLAIAVAAAIVLGFEASTKQKRMERDFVRAGWRRLTKRTSRSWR
jgi:MFS superfamily sulfate permease-like transporter